MSHIPVAERLMEQARARWQWHEFAGNRQAAFQRHRPPPPAMERRPRLDETGTVMPRGILFNATRRIYIAHLRVDSVDYKKSFSITRTRGPAEAREMAIQWRAEKMRELAHDEIDDDAVVVHDSWPLEEEAFRPTRLFQEQGMTTMPDAVDDEDVMDFIANIPEGGEDPYKETALVTVDQVPVYYDSHPDEPVPEEYWPPSTRYDPSTRTYTISYLRSNKRFRHRLPVRTSHAAAVRKLWRWREPLREGEPQPHMSDTE